MVIPGLDDPTYICLIQGTLSCGESWARQSSTGGCCCSVCKMKRSSTWPFWMSELFCCTLPGPAPNPPMFCILGWFILDRGKNGPMSRSSPDLLFLSPGRRRWPDGLGGLGGRLRSIAISHVQVWSSGRLMSGRSRGGIYRELDGRSGVNFGLTTCKRHY